MSDAKRAELQAAGRLRPDGSRIELCPVCGQPLPEGMTTTGLADGEHGVGEAVAVEVGALAPEAEG